MMYKGVGLPTVFYTKLKITNQVDITTGTLQSRTYALNSLYDPY